MTASSPSSASRPTCAARPPVSGRRPSAARYAPVTKTSAANPERDRRQAVLLRFASHSTTPAAARPRRTAGALPGSAPGPGRGPARARCSRGPRRRPGAGARPAARAAAGAPRPGGSPRSRRRGPSAAWPPGRTPRAREAGSRCSRRRPVPGAAQLRLDHPGPRLLERRRSAPSPARPMPVGSPTSGTPSTGRKKRGSTTTWSLPVLHPRRGEGRGHEVLDGPPLARGDDVVVRLVASAMRSMAST